uniref:TFIIS central domain-containing protein n=1 Tax=Heterorhabditis bacteriophora TaxID=37862 RepID=A0A1I7XHZ4_HETBA
MGGASFSKYKEALHLLFSQVEPEMKLADSLTSMLGEFVAIQKTPDFKLCSLSTQEINRAVKEEKRTHLLKEKASLMLLYKTIIC